MKKLLLSLLLIPALAFGGNSFNVLDNTATTVSGGTIDGATIGATTPAAGAFTSLKDTGLTTGLILGSAGGAFTTYTAQTCTNQLIRNLSASGVATCATIGSNDLAASLSLTTPNIGAATGTSLDGTVIGGVTPAAGNFTAAVHQSVGWSATGASPADVSLFRGSANVLQMRNGTNGQAFNIYNTYTDASNFEDLTIKWAGNAAQIFANAAGTGSYRLFSLGTSGGGNIKQIYVDYTNTGTVGAVTINKAAGRVNLAAAGTSLTVTDSLVTAASHCFLNADSAPGNVVAVQFYAIPAAGSFTVNAVPAVTNQTAIDFFCVNAD